MLKSIKDDLLKLFNMKPSKWRRAVTADIQSKTYASNEGGDRYHIEFKLKAAKMPEASTIEAFMKEHGSDDKRRLVFHNENFKETKSGRFETRDTCNQDSYRAFCENLASDNVLRVELNIEKNTKDRVCNIYEWKAFSEFVLGERQHDLLSFSTYLNTFIKAHPEGVGFMVLDEEADYVTRGFAFANASQSFPHFRNRSVVLDRYNNGSLFMDKANNVLLPGDFHADEKHCTLPKEREKEVKATLERYETMYSLIYLAALSWIEDGKSALQPEIRAPGPDGPEYKLGLQIVKGGLAFLIPVKEISGNENIFKLVSWAFAKNGGSERPGIAREVISRYCRNEKDILSIRENILESAKSGHNLYTVKAVDQYVKLKSDLSKSILESTKQVQTLIESLIDGLGKNFVAVITVITAQVLAGHINWDTYASGKFRTEDFKSVIWIFVAASTVYMIANIITTFYKWGYYRDRYNLMYDQYKSLLDEDDLKRAFDNDKLINSARTKLVCYSVLIFILWALLIGAVLYFGIYYVKVPS